MIAACTAALLFVGSDAFSAGNGVVLNQGARLAGFGQKVCEPNQDTCAWLLDPYSGVNILHATHADPRPSDLNPGHPFMCSGALCFLFFSAHVRFCESLRPAGHLTHAFEANSTHRRVRLVHERGKASKPEGIFGQVVSRCCGRCRSGRERNDAPGG